MDLKKLVRDDEAVSPVIGVILMVAITVILAAVIASFVLGLGDQAQQTTPQASFAFDYSADVTDQYVTVTHDGGDTIAASELYIRGNEIADNGNSDQGTGQWSGDTTSDSEVVAGNSVDIGVNNDEYEMRVVYQSAEGDNSATLAQDSGPGA